MVWSRPIFVLTPARTFCPLCRMMILPGPTTSPPNFLTPRRCPGESRPFFVEPPAFFVASLTLCRLYLHDTRSFDITQIRLNIPTQKVDVMPRFSFSRGEEAERTCPLLCYEALACISHAGVDYSLIFWPSSRPLTACSSRKGHQGQPTSAFSTFFDLLAFGRGTEVAEVLGRS